MREEANRPLLQPGKHSDQTVPKQAIRQSDGSFAYIDVSNSQKQVQNASALNTKPTVRQSVQNNSMMRTVEKQSTEIDNLQKKVEQ